MVLTLIGVLEGLRILPAAFWAAGAAVLIASAWTTFRIHTDVAEILIEGPFASVRTIGGVLEETDAQPQQVLDVTDYGGWMHATIGLDTYELDRDRWPNYTELATALRNCASIRRSAG